MKLKYAPYAAYFDYATEIRINCQHRLNSMTSSFKRRMKIWNCQCLGNRIEYEAEISYVEVAYDADLGYGSEIRINCQIDQI